MIYNFEYGYHPYTYYYGGDEKEDSTYDYSMDVEKEYVRDFVEDLPETKQIELFNLLWKHAEDDVKQGIINSFKDEELDEYIEIVDNEEKLDMQSLMNDYSNMDYYWSVIDDLTEDDTLFDFEYILKDIGVTDFRRYILDLFDLED